MKTAHSETLIIGATPCNEECAQLGDIDYPERSQRECRAFIKQLLRAFPNKPEGVEFVVKHSRHDFGTYREVGVRFDMNNRRQANYAFKVEAKAPEDWDDEAKAELGLI